MRIVVLGAGTVGTSIAELLCHHRHSVTVVDRDASHARQLNERLDVRALTGSASQSSVLFQAGVLGSDLCLAVTGDDEVNLVAASLCKAMGAGRTLARVYAAVFRDLSTFDYSRHFNIDRLLSLEHLSALELARDIGQPNSVAIKHLARGGLEVQELLVTAKTPAVGVPLRSLTMPRGVRIGSILRDGRLTIAGADDSLAVGDRITLFGGHEEVAEVQSWFRKDSTAKRVVAIAGGGETGYHLAHMLDGQRCHVLLLESDRQRCEFLANHLPRATVVNRDCTRRDHLEEERVGTADVFVACTGDDEDNIMAAVEARELGARKIMAIVGRPDYANVVGKLGIDHAVSPREVMAKQVLGYLHRGPLVSRAPLFGGGIDVLELEVFPEVPATEHVLAELALPPRCLIAAVIHDGYARVPGADDRLRAGDTIVALVHEDVADDTVELFSANGRRSPGPRP